MDTSCRMSSYRHSFQCDRMGQAPGGSLATATLVINTPQKITLEATGTNLREVVVPAGTRYLQFSSTTPWYWEPDTGQADADAGTAASQQRVDSGTGALRMPGSGGGRALLT